MTEVPNPPRPRLHVNVDHVATLRQARGTDYPDPVHVAKLALAAGCDGITVHLREDRRHIQDDDVRRLKASLGGFLNLEMAATEEMVAIARAVQPDMVTLVPERREERTTEGGLSVGTAACLAAIGALQESALPVSLFIDPSEDSVRGAKQAGVEVIELHTGDYANATGVAVAQELARLRSGAELGARLGLRLAAGHGLTQQNTGPLLDAVPLLEELNIGHALVSDAVVAGIGDTVRAYRRVISGSAVQTEAKS